MFGVIVGNPPTTITPITVRILSSAGGVEGILPTLQMVDQTPSDLRKERKLFSPAFIVPFILVGASAFLVFGLLGCAIFMVAPDVGDQWFLAMLPLAILVGWQGARSFNYASLGAGKLLLWIVGIIVLVPVFNFAFKSLDWESFDREQRRRAENEAAELERKDSANPPRESGRRF